MISCLLLNIDECLACMALDIAYCLCIIFDEAFTAKLLQKVQACLRILRFIRVRPVIEGASQEEVDKGSSIDTDVWCTEQFPAYVVAFLEFSRMCMCLCLVER
jgi:hypothetical protein